LRTWTQDRSKVLWGAFFAGQLAAILLARLALIQPLYAMGLLYAVGFCVLAWNRPSIALLLIFAAAPFQQSLVPGAPVLFSLTEVNIALMLPVMLLRNTLEKRRIEFGPLAGPLAFYFAVCLLATLLSWRGRDSLVSLIQMVLYLVFGLFIFSSYARRPTDFLPSLRGLIAVAIFFSIVMLVQRTNYILDLHKNGVGASVACGLLVAVEMWFGSKDQREKRWLVVAMAIMLGGLLYSLSRGSWLGCIVGLSWIAAMRGEWKFLIRGALVFLPLLAIGWSSLPQDQREYATGFGRENWNINERYKSVDYAKERWEQNPVLGVGVGLREEYDATNVAWLALAETGVLGLGAFAILHLAFLGELTRARRWVQREPLLFSLVIIGGALVLRQVTHGMVDHYWGRGPLCMSWAAAGMAIYAYTLAQRHRSKARPVGEPHTS
jgi:hypothetical protein